MSILCMMQDVPTYLPEGTILPCNLPREDVRDVFISPKVSPRLQCSKTGLETAKSEGGLLVSFEFCYMSTDDPGWHMPAVAAG
jgi:hypothetical protein